jgi:hypothetical protein
MHGCLLAKTRGMVDTPHGASVLLGTAQQQIPVKCWRVYHLPHGMKIVKLLKNEGAAAIRGLQGLAAGSSTAAIAP